MCIYGCFLWLQLPSPLLIEDIDLLEDEHTHSPALSSVDSTGDGSKVRAHIPFVYGQVIYLCLNKVFVAPSVLDWTI